MKKNATQIAAEVYAANRPIDYEYLNYLNRTMDSRERIEWAKSNIQDWFNVGEDITPCMLGRAARELCTLCFDE